MNKAEALPALNGIIKSLREVHACQEIKTGALVASAIAMLENCRYENYGPYINWDKVRVEKPAT